MQPHFARSPWCWRWYRFLASCSKPAPAEEPVRAVKLLTVGIESMTSGSEFAGEVRARVESRLGSRVAGKLVRRQVEIGQRVRVGQVIAQLDAQDFKLATEAMRAQLPVFDRPFGFVALLGVIALMGMIQRNSVILIDQTEQDRAAGIHHWDAIVESAVRRLRPIVLTAAAAVLAMIPLSRSVFWGPMAVAIMGGLIVATALTLLALAAMYAAWYRVQRGGTPAG